MRIELTKILFQFENKIVLNGFYPIEAIIGNLIDSTVDESIGDSN